MVTMINGAYGITPLLAALAQSVPVIVRMHKILIAIFALSAIASVSSLANQLQDEMWGGTSAHTGAGQALNGFALSLTAQTSSIQLGKPIWVTVEVRNLSGETLGAFFGSRHSNYSFTIVNEANHRPVEPDPHNLFGLDSISGPQNGHRIYANTSLYGKFRLDLLYRFSAAGVYTVQVSKGVPIINGQRVELQSNTIKLTLTP